MGLFPWEINYVKRKACSHSYYRFQKFSCLAGERFIKLAKSPISPPLAFPFTITSSGISLLNDDGQELRGTEISTIHCQGLSLTHFLVARWIQLFSQLKRNLPRWQSYHHSPYAWKLKVFIKLIYNSMYRNFAST